MRIVLENMIEQGGFAGSEESSEAKSEYRTREQK